MARQEAQSQKKERQGMLLNTNLVFNVIILSINFHNSPTIFHYKIQEVGEDAGSGRAQVQSEAHTQVQVTNDSVCSGKLKESEDYNANLSFTSLLTVILLI